MAMPFPDISVLRRNRNFAYLFIGQFVSLLGTLITSVALPYQIYHLTHSTLMVGLVSLFQLFPLLVTALVGGVLADRKHRKMLLITAEILLAVGCLGLTFNAWISHPQVWVIFILSAIMSGVNGLHRPALEGIVQQMVDKKDYMSISSLSMFKFNVCMIGGPAIGGLLIAHVGLVATYLLDLASFIISLGALLMISHFPKPKQQHDQSGLADLRDGIKYAWSRQELLGSYSVDFIAMVFGMPMALFPAIAHSYGSVKILGLLYAAPAVGGLIVSCFSGWAVQVKRHGAAIAYSAILWGVAIILFGLAPNIELALMFLAAAGAFDALSGIYRTTMWNETIPTEFRGRLAGIEMISYMSGPKLGDTEAGLVAAMFGVTASIVSGGVLCIVGVGALCYALPKFWNYRSSIVLSET